MKIFKYTLPFQATHLSTFAHEIPRNAQFLTAQLQYGEPTLWYLVDPTTETEERVFTIVETGRDFHDFTAYLGSFQLGEGRFVGHIFDITKEVF